MTYRPLLIAILFGLAIAPGRTNAQNVYNYDGNVEVRIEIQHYVGRNWQAAPVLRNMARYRLNLIVSNVSRPLSNGFTRDYVDFKFKISGPGMRFYTDANYAGSYLASYDGFPNKGLQITQGRANNFYVHFVWDGRDGVPVVPMGPLMPKLSVQAVEINWRRQPEGPQVPVQPNVN